MRIFAAVIGFVAFITGVTVIFGSWYTVDTRERGVILRTGAVQGVATPGLGFKLPLVDSVVRINLEQKMVPFEGMHIYSRDQQPAVVTISVNYRPKSDDLSIIEIYESWGGESGVVQRLIAPRVNEVSKTVFGRFAAATAIQERGRLNLEMFQAIQESVVGPIIIESVQVESIDFSDAYEASIEQRMLAEVEVQRLRQNAERAKVEAEITVTQAGAQADAVRAQAQAAAEAVVLQGEAEAEAIRAKAQALRENPELIQLIQAERWNGQLPTTMLPGGAVPMLNMNPPTVLRQESN